MSGNPIPPPDENTQNAINQLNQDNGQYKKDEDTFKADIQLLLSFLKTIDQVAQRDGAGVALQMMMTQGFADIDTVKNDNFTLFADSLNINTDVQTLGTMAQGFVNEGSSKDGISYQDTANLYWVLKDLEGVKDDPYIDAETGSLVSTQATTIYDTLFGTKYQTPDIHTAQGTINDYFKPSNTLSPFVKTVDNAFDEISTSTNSSSQMLQTKASVASNTYKEFLGVDTKLISNIDSQNQNTVRHFTSQG